MDRRGLIGLVGQQDLQPAGRQRLGNEKARQIDQSHACLSQLRQHIAIVRADAFMFVLAAGSDKKHESEGVHLEVWDQTLVLVRESRDDADLATICDLKTAKNRLHLQLLIDQETGSIAVHSLDGRKLGEIDVEVGEDESLSWVFLRNHRGDVRFEQLVVSQ